MRVLIADDHALVRSAIRALVAVLPDVTEVLEAADGREALGMAKAESPDVVLLDIGMPGLNGLEAIPRIVKEAPATRVIILSMHEDAQYVARALQHGASGYLVKHATPAELELALKAATRGEMYLSPAIARQVVHRIRAEPSSLDRLTPRQREVLQLIAEGYTNREIAETLGVGVKTVETHRLQLMKELDVHDVAGLVWLAVGVGLVQVE